MKAVVDIPSEVYEVLRANPHMSRDNLQNICKITQHQARIYVWIWKHGKPIYANNILSNPESGTKKALILPDIHWPYHEQGALDLAINYGVGIKPDLVVIFGDAADNYSISHYRKDPTRMPFREEIVRVGEGLKYVSDAFPDAEKVFIEGNHELRVRSMLWNRAQELVGLKALEVPELYGMDKTGWQYVSNSDLLCNDLPPFSLGKLFLLHGHEVKINYSVVNIPRMFYLRTHVNVMVAHHHRTQEYITRTLEGDHEGGWSVGCLCKLSPEYSPSNEWNHGFAVVEWDAEGIFSVTNHKIIDGRVL